MGTETLARDKGDEGLETLFHKALEFPAEDRAAFLESHCGCDDAMLRRLELLLRNDAPDFALGGLEPEEAAGDGLPGDGADARQAESPVLPAGTMIGRYRLVRLIADGGMGTVYEAEQEHPRRIVALKLMKRGIGTRAAIRRFRHECQILATLHHPGIAQVYDVGVYAEGGGVPYFVMEHIDGAQLLTEYAGACGMGLRAKLELFASVCDAVHHGHQKGIIHRDLKPANILVDGAGRVKVIDFGVARATDSDVAVTTIQTDVGTLIGTLQYMSPEQTDSDPRQVDIRSDVYSLGVVLYELLCGRLPYEAQGGSVLRAVLTIRQQAPARPSTIQRSLRGDIETIVLKALEKDRERRYQSASDLAGDVRRYLFDRPISARPASAAYQLRTFARRNKALAGGALATLATMLAALVAISLTYLNAEAQRKAALESEQRAVRAEADAEQRAEHLQQVAVFQARQLGSIDVALMGERLRSAVLARIDEANERAGPDAQADIETARGLIDRVNFTSVALNILDQNIFEQSLAAIAGEFENQPLIQARLYQSLANTLRDLGLFERALVPQERALELCRNHAGEGAALTATSWLEFGSLMINLGRYEEAHRALNEALTLRQRLFGEDARPTAMVVNTIGVLLHAQNRGEESEAAFRHVLDVLQRDPETRDDDPFLLTLNANIGLALDTQGRDGTEYLRATVEGRRRLLGDEHRSTLKALTHLAAMRRMAGDSAEAEALAREAWTGYALQLGEDHPETIWANHQLALACRELGHYEEAVDRSRYVAVNARRHMPRATDHRVLAFYVLGYGRALAATGQFEEGERELLEGHAILHAALGADHEYSVVATELLAKFYEQWHNASPDDGHDARAAALRGE